MFFFLMLQELQKHGSPGIVMVLVGNKADLHENRSVSSQVRIYARFHVRDVVVWLLCVVDDTVSLLQDAQEYAEKNNMFFIETSAKTADNINQLFEVCFEYRKLFVLKSTTYKRPRGEANLAGTVNNNKALVP